MTTLKAQRISSVSNGGHTVVLRTVTGVRTTWGTETGFAVLYGTTYRVARVAGKTNWAVGSSVTIYPAGHPLASLNPVEFGGTK